ncbi:MAG TPA: hypothetical protein VN364_10260 [Bellilinea sp.]|nr:hypothetical protein [Bellilinea sp.]
MTDQYYKNPDETSEIIGEIDKDTIPETIESDAFADRTPVDESLINDTPMGGTVASVEPLSGPLPDEVQLFETPNQEIPMGGTLAAVGQMDETIVNEVPFAEVVIPEPQVVEPDLNETWENKLGKLNLYNEPKDETVVPVVPVVDNVPPPSLADESLPEETLESKINDLDPCDDPMDEILRQKEHVATTGGLAN